MYIINIIDVCGYSFLKIKQKIEFNQKIVS